MERQYRRVRGQLVNRANARVPTERELLTQISIAELMRENTIGPGTVESINRTLRVANAWELKSRLWSLPDAPGVGEGRAAVVLRWVEQATADARNVIRKVEGERSDAALRLPRLDDGYREARRRVITEAERERERLRRESNAGRPDATGAALLESSTGGTSTKGTKRRSWSRSRFRRLD